MRWNLRKKSENVSENKNSDKLTNERKVPSAVVFSVARARNFRTFNLLIKSGEYSLTKCVSNKAKIVDRIYQQ